jgi:pentatricopeptide repeat protein
LTQASQTSVDSGLNQTDDTEDPFFRPGPVKSTSKPLTTLRRPRSHSLVLGSQGQVENTETANRPGVLEVVQIHARASHAFAPHNSAVDDAVADPVPLESRPKLSRRASTSSVTSSPPSEDIPSPSLHPQPVPSLDPPILQPAVPSAAQIRAKLAEHLSRKDGSACTYVNQLLANDQFPQDAIVYEAAIQAVAIHYKSKAGVSLLTKLFDDMVKRDLSPSAQTYETLIVAHLGRDQEVANAIGRHQQSIASRKASNKVIPKHRDQDVKSVSILRSEPNLRNAIRIFQAANKARVEISPEVHAHILNRCVDHLDDYAALRVFAHLEKEHGSRIPSSAYLDMMQLYLKTNNLAAAEETFSDFKKVAQLGNVSYGPSSASSYPTQPPARVAPWDLMIDIYFRAGRQTEALTILEAMLDSSDPSVPRPLLSTFQAVIVGFCRDDVETALKWFQRLLQEPAVVEDASALPSAPPRPDVLLWNTIIDALAQKNMIDEINSLYFQWLPTNSGDSPLVVGTVRRLVTWANVAHLEALQWSQSLASSEVQKKVDHVMEKIIGDPRDWIFIKSRAPSDLMYRIVKLYGRDGRFDEAAKFLQTYVRAHQTIVGTPQAGAELTSTQSRLLFVLGNRVLDTIEWILRRQIPPSFAIAKEFVSVANGLDKGLSAEAADTYLSIYEASKKSGQPIPLTVSDAETLIAAGVCVIYTNREPIDGRPESHPLVRFETLLIDVAGHLRDLSQLSPTAVDGVLRGLQTWYPPDSLQAVLEKLGEPWSALWNHPLVQEQASLITPAPAPEAIDNTPLEETSQPSTPSSGTAVTTYRISTPLSLKVDAHLNNFKTASPIKAYEKFISGYTAGFYPVTATFGKLINALGRAGEIEKVNLVYEAAQHAIATAPDEDPNGSWYQIEDQMIIALAHAGDVEGAHNHRLSILEYGGTPSADAYGALISCVKDTTDDSANAYTLYRESQIRGLVPNVYLYNTMISKLAKARKADLAMELFSKMKANGFWPSSVSYGAVIGACSRVGDVESAEALFEEMSSQPNFKPRVPPFNTMMQLYTYTKRNREKVLHYYDSMVSAGVRPTAHTYKVCRAPVRVFLNTLTLGPSS